MKNLLFLAIGGGIMMAGCETAKPPRTDVRIVQSINNLMVQNAILAQRTLYPYHFEPGQATLTELGQRELDVIAAAYRTNPGSLTVRKASTPDELYQGRLACVRDRLGSAGVNVSLVRIEDGPPMGPGRPASEVLSISQDRNSPSRPMYYDQGSGGSVQAIGNLSAIGGAGQP